MNLCILIPLVVALLISACGGGESSTEKSETPAGPATAESCSKSQLKTVAPDTLTIATDQPAYPPYFVDNDPTNGQGFESATAYAIAEKLGFEKAQVKWSTVAFNASYAPGVKKFDFDLNQISITPKRQKVVDFSEPYFTAPQALVAKKGSSIIGAKSLADVRDAQLGVQVGSTSFDATKEVVRPSVQAKVFNTSTDIITALKQGQVEGVIVDLPTAFYVTATQVKGSEIVGQFDAPGGDDWGALLSKDSPLTPCVSKAISDLRSEGELQRIYDQWLGEAAGAPKLG